MPRKLPRPKQQGKPYTKAQREEIIESLKPYLVLGYDLKNACINAEATYETVWDWVKKDNALLIRIKSWQNMISAKARKNIAKSIEDGDISISQWWVERREKKDFSLRTEQESKIDTEIKFILTEAYGNKVDSDHETEEGLGDTA